MKSAGRDIYIVREVFKGGDSVKIFNMYQADVFVRQGCRVKRILRIENKNCESSEQQGTQVTPFSYYSYIF